MDEFVAVLDDIVQAMQEMNYPRSVCDEVLGISYSLKGETVHKQDGSGRPCSPAARMETGPDLAFYSARLPMRP
ncbi:hypothetical protein [Thioalkalivibrio sp. ALJT]|uniref:hypothetical protein n=1 Tax=Thioalkalivibrio sp. ALJT TaxID=1158146 RepID=UPI0003739C66|nr:hypothetical protein [Thioalkalivibrio sp. ALJT]